MINIIDQLDGSYEFDYFTEISKFVSVNQDLDLVFMKWDQDIPDTKNPMVLFVTSDEHHKYHEKFTNHPNLLLTFRNYLPAKQHPKVKALPLGYLQGFEHPDVNFAERIYDYSFLGTLPDPPCDPTRHNMKYVMSHMDNNYKDFVLFYRGWNKGLNTSNYAKIMYNTKVALCPKGYTSNETFRYFEAAKAGCVIISEFKPDVWYYKDAPHVKINNWFDLPKILYSLLDNPIRLKEFHQKTQTWWDQYCSPHAVGKYVTTEIHKALNEG